MPRSQQGRTQLTSLEAQQRKMRERVVAERRTIATADTRRRAAIRTAHEQSLLSVLRRYEVDKVSPQDLAGMLAEMGLRQRRRYAESDKAERGGEAPSRELPAKSDHMSPSSVNDTTEFPATTK